MGFRFNMILVERAPCGTSDESFPDPRIVPSLTKRVLARNPLIEIPDDRDMTILGSGKDSSLVPQGARSTSIMLNRKPILGIRWRRAILSLSTGRFHHALRRSSGT